jgi:hypothetical protein
MEAMDFPFRCGVSRLRNFPYHARLRVAIYLCGFWLKNYFPIGACFNERFVGRVTALEEQNAVREIGQDIEIKIERIETIAKVEPCIRSEKSADPSTWVIGLAAPFSDQCSGDEHIVKRWRGGGEDRLSYHLSLTATA